MGRKKKLAKIGWNFWIGHFLLKKKILCSLSDNKHWEINTEKWEKLDGISGCDMFLSIKKSFVLSHFSTIFKTQLIGKKLDEIFVGASFLQ